MQSKWDKLKVQNWEKIQNYRGSEDGRVDFYPRYIQLEHTNYCNAQCIMCNHFYLDNSGASHINVDIIEKIKPILPYCQTIMLNGDGEPFLCKDIEKYIEIYCKYNVRVSTNTNFCYIPEKLWRMFEDTFDLLNISCDGASKKTFEYIRRGLSFEIFCKNLERLNEVAPKLRKHLDCVIMRQNIQEAAQIVEFASKMKFEKVKFHMLGVNPCIRNQQDSARSFLEIAKYYMHLAKEKAKELEIAIEIPAELCSEILKEVCDEDFDNGMSIDMTEKKMHVQKQYGMHTITGDYLKYQANLELIEDASWYVGKKCLWGLERCYIDLNGNVTTCCFNTRYHLGNLKKQTFDEIWNGELYRAFRKKMDEKLLPDWCKQCNWINE